MTFLKKLQDHRGGLIRLPAQLFWYGRGWDDTPGRVCLLLDAYSTAATIAASSAAYVRLYTGPTAYAHLLIDGQPRWVRMAEGDVEFL